MVLSKVINKWIIFKVAPSGHMIFSKVINEEIIGLALGDHLVFPHTKTLNAWIKWSLSPLQTNFQQLITLNTMCFHQIGTIKVPQILLNGIEPNQT